MRALVMAFAAAAALPVHAQSLDGSAADEIRLAMGEQNASECARSCAADSRCLTWTFIRAGVEGPAAVCRIQIREAASGIVREPATMTAMSRIVPKRRAVQAVEEVGPTEPTEPSETAAATGLAPVGPAGTASDLVPTGMTGSIGRRKPALSPLAPPVTAPATEPPLDLTPSRWEGHR